MAKLNFSIALGLAANNFKQGLSGVQNQLKGFASSVKSTFGMIAGAFAAGQIKAFSQECMNAYSAQMQAEQKLSVIMKQRMSATDAEIQSVMQLASAQQQLGVIGDEVQLAGAQQVATFLNEKKSLDTLIPAMNNLLAQQKGLNASQGDAVSIGNLMGKVLQGQTSALKRVGITFDEAQEKVLKFGTESERAAMLAKVIEQNVGNMNAELAKTDAGKIKQMENTLGDMKEKIGAALTPIVAELAPTITELATTISEGLVTAINFIKENFGSVANFIVATFAAIKLTPIIQSWVAQAASAEAQATAKAQAYAARREALEQRVATTKRNIATQMAALEEASGAKEVAIRNRVTTMKETLKRQELALEQAKLAEEEALNAAAAASETTMWSVAWSSIRTAGVVCWTTIKAAMISTGIGALIIAVVFAVQKLWEWFSKLEKVQNIFSNICYWFKTAWKWICDLIMKCKNWYDGLGTIGKMVVNMIAPFLQVYNIIKKIVDLLGQKNYVEKVEITDDKGGKKDPEKPLNLGGGGGGKTGKGGGSNRQKSPAEQAAEDVANAEKEYTEAIRVAESDVLTINEKLSKSLSATNSLYDAYESAYGKTGNKKYETRMAELYQQMANLKTSVEGLTEADEKEKKEVEERSKKRTEEALKRIKAEADYAKAMEEIKQKFYKGRDSTFDYKKSKDEIVEAKLQFNLDIVNKQIEELKKKVEAGCRGAVDELNEALKNATSLEDALKLNQVREDIKKLRDEVRDSWENLATQGWQNLEGSVNNVISMLDTLNNADASGWEKICAVVDTAIGLFQSVVTVIELVNAVKKASAIASAAETAAAKFEAVAIAKVAAAKIFAAHASIPFAGVGLAAGMVGTMSTVMTGLNALALSTGGKVKGSSLHGDFVPALLNSGETVINHTQESRLLALANGASNTNNYGGGSATSVVRGEQLVQVINAWGKRSGKGEILK